VYPADYTIKHGDTGFPVSMIQFLLQEISLDYDFEPHVTITGIYDEATENAVKAFQERNMLPVTGVVDRQTWCRIADYFNTTMTEYSQ
jgi:peptidoglycan hydrolase-like protein with peptidoglycan-binding domain